MEKNKVVLKPKVLVDKDQALARLRQVMGKVGKRHGNISEKEIDSDVLEAIKMESSKSLSKLGGTEKELIMIPRRRSAEK